MASTAPRRSHQRSGRARDRKKGERFHDAPPLLVSGLKFGDIEHLIGYRAHSRAVGSDEDCPSVPVGQERVEEAGFGLAVQMRARFVHEDKFHVACQRACESYSLYLPAGQAESAFTKGRVEAIGEVDKEVGDACLCHGALNHLSRDRGIMQGDIIPQGAVKQARVLADPASAPGQRRGHQRPIYPHLAGG